MASKNVETLRAAHDNWNRRDFAGVSAMQRRGWSTPTMRGVLT